MVASGAELADEMGIGSVSLAALAERLGVKPPALYKHVDSIGDLQHRIATLAMTELGDVLREALQGKSGAEAIGRSSGRSSPTSTNTQGATPPPSARRSRPDDPLLAAATRVIDSIRAVLSGYGIPPDELDHAIRMLRCTIHGYAVLKASNAFQWSNKPDQSVAWMIRFIDAGLTKVGVSER